ncbi:cation-translocating P-type ATPase [Magnetococcales bacterium HHB-1]
MDMYQMPVNDVLTRLGGTLEGLSTHEATRRLEQEGENRLTTAPPPSPWRILLAQFEGFIIYILLFAVLFSFILQEYVDATIILLILILNAGIGFFQEWSAVRSLDALKKMSGTHSRVKRDGKWIDVDSSNLVCGDIIRLEEGDKVPADARLVKCVRLAVDESALTGESLPVEKHDQKIDNTVPLAEQRNRVFSTTAVVKGHATAVITETAMDTEIGKISRLIQEAPEEMTPLQRRLDIFGKKLGWAVLLICLMVFAVSAGKAWMDGGLSHETLLGFFLVAVGLAVAAVPEALPAVVTAALSVGVKRLLRQNALVRKLSSIETLGGCDVICSDKTGTLTQNEMTVRRVWIPEGEASLHGVGYYPGGSVSRELDPLVYRIGLYCNNAQLKKGESAWSVRGDPTEGALLVSASKAGIHEVSGEKINEIPFDSERKRMSVLVKEGKDLTVMSKGAPDRILSCCNKVRIHGLVHPLTDAWRDTILQWNDRYASQAMRVLAFAYKEIDDPENFNEDDLVFAGLQAMIDPPRPDVKRSLERAHQAGIRVVMITGDYKETACAVGREIGVEGLALTGTDLDDMDEKAIQQSIREGTNLFSRVAPKHKYAIVQALQNMGHTVAMTGDGVNDAPALKKADIGVAVGSGTEVAKEASDFVLLDNSFTTIVNAVEEGRGIYDNIQKSIMLLLSGNLGEVMILFMAALLGWNLPLTAILLLWVNLVTDGAPALAFSVDAYSESLMRRAPRPAKEGILPRAHLMLIGMSGLVGTGLSLVLFALYGGIAGDEAATLQAQTMVFNFLVLYEVILVFVIRAEYGTPLFGNNWIWVATGLALGLQGLLMYTPLHNLFKIVPLNLEQIGVLIVCGLIFFFMLQVYHHWMEQRGGVLFREVEA